LPQPRRDEPCNEPPAAYAFPPPKSQPKGNTHGRAAAGGALRRRAARHSAGRWLCHWWATG
jgi:hypothetical protein